MKYGNTSYIGMLYYFNCENQVLTLQYSDSVVIPLCPVVPLIPLVSLLIFYAAISGACSFNIDFFVCLFFTKNEIYSIY